MYSPTYANMRSSPYQSGLTAHYTSAQRGRRPTSSLEENMNRYCGNQNRSQSLGIANKLREFELQLESNCYRRQRDNNNNNRSTRSLSSGKRNLMTTPPPTTADMPIADGTKTHIRNTIKASSTEDYKSLTSRITVANVPFLSRYFLEKQNAGAGSGLRSGIASSTRTRSKDKGKSTTTVTSHRTPAISSSLAHGANLFGPFAKQLKKKQKTRPAARSKQSIQIQRPSPPTLTTGSSAPTTAQNAPQGIVPLSPQRYLTHRPPSVKQKTSSTKFKPKASFGVFGLIKSNTHVCTIQDQLEQQPPLKRRPKVIQLSPSGRLNICSAKSSTSKMEISPTPGSVEIKIVPEKEKEPERVEKPQTVSASKLKRGKKRLPTVQVQAEKQAQLCALKTANSASSTIATNSTISMGIAEKDPCPSFNDLKDLTAELSDATDLESESVSIQHMFGNKGINGKGTGIPSSATDCYMSSMSEFGNAESEAKSVEKEKDMNNNNEEGDELRVKLHSKNRKLESKLNSFQLPGGPMALIKSGVFACAQSQRATTAAACVEGVHHRGTEPVPRSAGKRASGKSRYPHCPINPRKIVSNPSIQNPAASAPKSPNVNAVAAKRSKKSSHNIETSGEMTETGTLSTTTTYEKNGELESDLGQQTGLDLPATVTTTSLASAPAKLKGILKPSKHDDNNGNRNQKQSRSNRQSHRHPHSNKSKASKDGSHNKSSTSSGYSALASLGICTAQPGTTEWMDYWEKYDQALNAYKQSDAIYRRENQEYQQDIDKYTKEAARLALEEAMFRQSIGLGPKSGQEVIEKPVMGLTTLNGFVFDRSVNGPAAFLSSCGTKGFRLEIDVRGLDPDKIDIETEFNLLKVKIPLQDVKTDRTVVRSIVIGVPNDFTLGELEMYPIVNGWLIVEAPDKRSPNESKSMSLTLGS